MLDLHSFDCKDGAKWVLLFLERKCLSVNDELLFGGSSTPTFGPSEACARAAFDKVASL